MNLQNLFVMQEKLDNHIMEEHNLYGKTLFSEKLLALQVEIAELANETRCFKFWSNKGPSSKETILEEYVDCLHFILTIGLEKNYTDTTFTISKEGIDVDITEQFLNLYIDINDFIICSSKDHYETLFEDFLLLGNSLSFSEKEIENAYYRKNTINHNRQVIGY
ncbi:dUTPase [Clostridium liquoris]|jgi:dimeric dUTPase (all-alpha-NTP-PPase superfamily)|uniref:dUTPase n=1 Tax=Clostridium liquoris TaxID=1289519 RepID=A0A2T0B200_9CLOT|nr:dUTP diphosphatase [Clostridium liquoris]PRR77926.1 dUTPase [Clostridium liquoris]